MYNISQSFLYENNKIRIIYKSEKMDSYKDKNNKTMIQTFIIGYLLHPDLSSIKKLKLLIIKQFTFYNKWIHNILIYHSF